MHEYTVIVAEDEELLLRSLVKKIENLNLNLKVIGTAPTGLLAYELTKKYLPDILISDIRMPVMDGIELLTKVHEEFPFIRLLIVSSYSDFNYAKTGITLGVSDYLLKPIETEVLAEAMANIICQLKSEHSVYENIFDFSADQNTPAYIAETLKIYIQQNYTENINLNLIATNINYSPSYLTKIFTSKFGCTPSKYIIKLRIQKAQKLLHQYPQVSVQQIGEMVGYPDQGYFSRIFKKYVGTGPLEYRNAAQTDRYNT